MTSVVDVPRVVVVTPVLSMTCSCPMVSRMHGCRMGLGRGIITVHFVRLRICCLVTMARMGSVLWRMEVCLSASIGWMVMMLTRAMGDRMIC